MKSHGVNGLSSRAHQVLSRLSNLPRKMVSLHGTDHSSEFVLHELCDAECFNLSRAAYFVDNPDFDCLQGIAGFEAVEHKPTADWSANMEIERHLPSCKFNQKVKSVTHQSYKRAHKSNDDLVAALAEELMFSKPACYVWAMKHDNHGVLIYESVEPLNGLCEHLENGSHLLSFCPIV